MSGGVFQSHSLEAGHPDFGNWQYRAWCDCDECIAVGSRVFDHGDSEKERHRRLSGHSEWGVNDEPIQEWLYPGDARY